MMKWVIFSVDEMFLMVVLKTGNPRNRGKKREDNQRI